jgi:hypothetical protein
MAVGVGVVHSTSVESACWEERRDILFLHKYLPKCFRRNSTPWKPEGNPNDRDRFCHISVRLVHRRWLYGN